MAEEGEGYDLQVVFGLRRLHCGRDRLGVDRGAQLAEKVQDAEAFGGTDVVWHGPIVGRGRPNARRVRSTGTRRPVRVARSGVSGGAAAGDRHLSVP
ncbi:MAG: hypothetical protein NVS3B12_06580 [Acidimicrobiales bacterium]